jgi:hypothetical protein
VSRHRRGVALTVIALATGVGGCGGSTATLTPTAYAKVLCQAVAPFERDIANRQSALDPTKIKNAAQGKAALEGFLGSIATDTSQAATRLGSAGYPNVTHGKQIAGAFASLFARLRTTLGKASRLAHALPTDSPAKFKTAATQLGQSVRVSMSDLGSGLAQMKSPALEAAAKKVSDCQTLGG